MNPSANLQPPEPTQAAATAPAERADEVMLEGPHARLNEFFTLFRVMADFLRGFRTLHFVGPCVTVFGSARTKPESKEYALAREMGGGDCAPRFHRHDRWWAGHHGGGQPRGARSRRALGRL